MEGKQFFSAIAAMNPVGFGLSSSISTTLGGAAQVPFGGVEDSGFGDRECGTAAFDFFSEQRVVYVGYLRANRGSRAAGGLAPHRTVITLEPCPECGAAVGGRDACQRLFDGLGLRAFADSRYAAMRRLAVDCYACQHDQYIRSGRSLAAHLTGLAVAIEYGGPEQANDRVQGWLSRTRHIEKPAVPRVRGKVTIADVADVPPEEYATAVRGWAASVWDAWRPHHALAREWIAAAGRR